MSKNRAWALGLLSVVTAFLAAPSGPPAAVSTTESPTPSNVGATQSNALSKVVEPDHSFEDPLKSARLFTRDWKTDFSIHTVPFDEILSVVPKDGIPSIDDPKFIEP